MTTAERNGTTQHYARDQICGVAHDGQRFYCWCDCGFIETGWPNMAIARKSLDGHILKAHPRKAVAYEVRS